MWPLRGQGRRDACPTLGAFGAWLLLAAALGNQVASGAEQTAASLVEMEGKVEVSRAGFTTWASGQTNQTLAAGDRVRTGERSRAVVRLSDATMLRLGELTIVRIPSREGRRGGLNLLKGILYFFHRDKPGVFPVETPSAYAVIIGTEFNLAVADDGTTTLNLIDGRVEMTNGFGGLQLASGESAIAAPGQPPKRTAKLETVNVIQWSLYYPAVLDLDELPLAAAEQQTLAESLAAYRSGDLLAAVERYPTGRQPATDAERIYLAALLLVVGQVEGAEKELNELNQLQGLNEEAARLQALAGALKTVIAAVKFPLSPALSPSEGAREKRGAVDSLPKNARPHPGPLPQEREKTTGPSHATTLLAESYYQQSRADLEQALTLARRAAEVSTNFGFAWARVAELEFSFGRVSKARAALDKALELTPRNAQGWALKGFLAAADNRIRDAIAEFDQAIAIDGALGNAWLGRGLCHIRRGDRRAGLEDLQTAVMVEPQRAVLRSYLAKAFSDVHDNLAALNELRLAKEFDPNDPTAGLYSALINQRQNRINEAVHDLQQSEELNDNRSLFRSRLLLDQDRAVRGVNLAVAYQDAGMSDVAQREAGRAVDADPANYSAHLFLANSFQAQRDLKGINQRFEAPAITEYLLANLLSPVGAGTLAQSVSQQEYSKLFQSDGFGVASSTEYFSNGRWVEQGAQYGTFGNFSYAVSAYYNWDNGQRPNNELEQTELSVQLKQQLTAKDSAYFRTTVGEAEGGDLVSRYDPADANRGFHFEETQKPLLLAGYHREWQPGMHSLLLGGWFEDEQHVRNPEQNTLLVGSDSNNNNAITDVAPITIQQKYRNDVEFFSLEAQQLWQADRTTLIAGGRLQSGDLHTRNQHTNASILPFLFPYQPENVHTDFTRWSIYGYGYWRPIESLQLVAGLSYDWLRFPANFRFAPLSSAEDEDDQLSPKAGFVWTPLNKTTVRGAYSRSLGGVGFEQSFRLEPTQVAGFNQMFRSLTPESLTGANVDEPFETFNVSVEQQFGSGTFVALRGELLQSKFDRQIGVYDYDNDTAIITPGWTEQHVDYEEGALTATFNQLVGREWAFGALYRVSRANLETTFTDIPAGAASLGGFQRQTENEGILQHADLVAIFNHPSGFFAQFQALWYGQDNRADAASLPDDSFWQLNAVAGWRFLDRRLEVSAGVLNLTSQDYKLNPVNITPDLPRERTLTLGLKLNF